MADLTLLYDGGCPLCVREVRWLGRRDRALHGEELRLAFVDIDQPGYDPAAHAGVTYRQAMGRIHAIAADERAIDLACRFGYSLPNAYKSLGGALKELVEQTRKKKKRGFYEDRLEALRKSAGKARAEMAQQQGSRQSVSSENVYG